MPVSEDGVPYGSIDVNELDSADPKTDEAKAQVEALKARRDEGQAQANADAQRLAEAAAAQDATGNTDVPQDNRDIQGKPGGFDEKAAAQKSADEKQKQEAAKKSAPSSHDKG